MSRWQNCCLLPVTLASVLIMCLCISVHFCVVQYWHVSKRVLTLASFMPVMIYEQCHDGFVQQHPEFTVTSLSGVWFNGVTTNRLTCLLLLLTRRTPAPPSNRDPYGNASISSGSNSGSCKGSDCSPTKG